MANAKARQTSGSQNQLESAKMNVKEDGGESYDADVAMQKRRFRGVKRSASRFRGLKRF